MNRDEAFGAAYRRVFEAEFASLFRYLHRLTGDHAGASDIAQEAFVRLYQRGELPDDTRAWLATVANNLVRDEHRKTSRRRSLLEANPTEIQGAEVDAAPDEAVDRRDRRERVRRVLETLPGHYRRALLLRYEGYSYREIGAALDYRVSGVGKLLVRATRAFRTAYEGADASD